MIKQSGYPFRNYEVPKEACAKNVNYELAANKRRSLDLYRWSTFSCFSRFCCYLYFLTLCWLNRAPKIFILVTHLKLYGRSDRVNLHLPTHIASDFSLFNLSPVASSYRFIKFIRWRREWSSLRKSGVICVLSNFKLEIWLWGGFRKRNFQWEFCTFFPRI